MGASHPPLRAETLNRCAVTPLSDELTQRLSPVSLEHFHFLYDISAIDFPIFVIVQTWLVEFIKPKELCKELLDEIWAACLKPKRSFDVCILKSDRPKFEAAISSVRSEKLARLMSCVPHLDKKTVDLYSNLSASSQLVVKGGIDAEVARRVRASASLLVSSALDSEASLFTLSKMISCDPTLYDHSASVAMLCAIIAQDLGTKRMNEKEVTLVTQCGLFHDAGKTCVPSETLNKPGKLTPEEFAIIKNHTVFGRDELLRVKESGAPIDDVIIRVAHEHHEKFNGRGYPEGRAGRLETDPQRGIHLYSRICMIADVYSALLMKRIYKEAYEPTEALKIMTDSSDDYDPELFKKFVGKVSVSIAKHEGQAAYSHEEHGHTHEVHDAPQPKGRVIQLDGAKWVTEHNGPKSRRRHIQAPSSSPTKRAGG